MTRKNENPADANSGHLKTLRVQIDKIDLQILELLNKRASVACQIGKVKSNSGGEVFSAAREDEVLKNIGTESKGPLHEVTLKSVFRELISGCRSLQKPTRIAVLGPAYSYSHIAAITKFGRSDEFMNVGSVGAIFEEVARHHANLGIVPLENSTDGGIPESLESFIVQPEVKICGEIKLDIKLHLTANGDQSEIRRIYATPQALAQARLWLSKNLPQASHHEVLSTADAAVLVKRDPNNATVSSREAAVEYGLRILCDNIQDNPDIATRFAVLSTHDAEKSGDDKTAIMFQVSNSPGALADALAIFKSNKVNLNWIESFTHRFERGKQVFFVDFDGHHEDAKVKKTIKALEEECEVVKVLGSFPKAK